MPVFKAPELFKFFQFILDLFYVYECFAYKYACVLCTCLVYAEVRKGHWVL